MDENKLMGDAATAAGVLGTFWLTWNRLTAFINRRQQNGGPDLAAELHAHKLEDAEFHGKVEATLETMADQLKQIYDHLLGKGD